MKTNIKKNSKFIRLFLVIFSVLLFSGFGCRNADEAGTTENGESVEPTQEVSFDPPEPESDTSSENTQSESNISSSDVLAPPTSSDEASTNDLQEDSSASNINESLESNEEDNEESVIATNQTINQANTAQSEDTQDQESGKEADEDMEVLKLAKILAEIYGTFTNKDIEPYKNLENLKTYSTEAMQSWIENQTGQDISTGNDPFYGITTRSVSAGIIDSSDTEYNILVTCEREEISEENQSPKKFYQLIKMNFKKQGDEWKLSGAFWQ